MNSLVRDYRKFEKEWWSKEGDDYYAMFDGKKQKMTAHRSPPTFNDFIDWLEDDS